jgi:hypothetical protein
MKNTLESHIFDTRDKLNNDLGEELSTEAERETINQALSQASDWLDDEGWDTTADVCLVWSSYSYGKVLGGFPAAYTLPTHGVLTSLRFKTFT